MIFSNVFRSIIGSQKKPLYAESAFTNCDNQSNNHGSGQKFTINLPLCVVANDGAFNRFSGGKKPFCFFPVLFYSGLAKRQNNMGLFLVIFNADDIDRDRVADFDLIQLFGTEVTQILGIYHTFRFCAHVNQDFAWTFTRNNSFNNFARFNHPDQIVLLG